MLSNRGASSLLLINSLKSRFIKTCVTTKPLVKSSLLNDNIKIACYSTKTSGGGSGKERKRFYKDVSYNESFNTQTQQQQQQQQAIKYEINLDKRKLKTPNGRLFQVDNEHLAALIANEWRLQTTHIKQSTMHLNTLANTCIDNPQNQQSTQIIKQLIDYLKTDTILYRDLDNEKLLARQNSLWSPLIGWMNNKFPGLKLHARESLEVDNIEIGDSKELESYLASFNFNSLIALKFMIENLKSVILSIGLLNQAIDDANLACELSLLETQIQTDKWGKVEWFHNFEETEMKTRVSAALLFIYYNINSYEIKNKIKNIN